jgi:cation diffusion facilitator CzcD-associated flavoprotein CzcO
LTTFAPLATVASVARRTKSPEAPEPARPALPYAERLAVRKRESTAQLLLKCARLVNERALASLPHGDARVRPAHTQLFPHIALAGTRISELAEKLGITKQAVGQLVDDLEGLERRVTWTPKGRRGLLDGLAHLQSLEAELRRAIGAARFDALHEGLLALHDHLEAGEGSA